MNKSKYYDKIKMFYEKGLWTKEQVYEAVDEGLITEDEYLEIVKE